jgi:[ribosomal protein S18]-alanine N-acetyltransferase
MSVTIRPAVADDVAAILAIERVAESAAHWSQEQYSRRVAEGMILVAEEGPDITGFVCARVVAREWEIENIVVAEHKRRSGVGDELLRELLRRACEQSGASIWLEVRESNEAARRLYKKHEFRETGKRREYYRNPVEDAVLYELRWPN